VRFSSSQRSRAARRYQLYEAPAAEATLLLGPSGAISRRRQTETGAKALPPEALDKATSASACGSSPEESGDRRVHQPLAGVDLPLTSACFPVRCCLGKIADAVHLPLGRAGGNCSLPTFSSRDIWYHPFYLQLIVVLINASVVQRDQPVDRTSRGRARFMFSSIAADRRAHIL